MIALGPIRIRAGRRWVDAVVVESWEDPNGLEHARFVYAPVPAAAAPAPEPLAVHFAAADGAANEAQTRADAALEAEVEAAIPFSAMDLDDEPDTQPLETGGEFSPAPSAAASSPALPDADDELTQIPLWARQVRITNPSNR